MCLLSLSLSPPPPTIFRLFFLYTYKIYAGEAYGQPKCVFEFEKKIPTYQPIFFLTCYSKYNYFFPALCGERGGSVVECLTPEREVGGSKPTAAVLCPWARHFTPRKYWLITQEAVAPSRHDWKIVDWDVKPQHKQTSCLMCVKERSTGTTDH